MLRSSVYIFGHQSIIFLLLSLVLLAVDTVGYRVDTVSCGHIGQPRLKVLFYPDPSLRAHNAPINDTAIKSARYREMLSIMYTSVGVGIAGPQLGINEQIFVYNPSVRVSDHGKVTWDVQQEVIVINPSIIEVSKTTYDDPDSCLSLPGIRSYDTRNNWIKVRYQNEIGIVMQKTLEGYAASTFQHEFDHLQGVLYIDKINEQERARVQPTLNQLISQISPSLTPAL